MLLSFALFHDRHLSVNINSYTTRIQLYMAVLKKIQNTEQNYEQNTNKANIPVVHNIFDILKSNNVLITFLTSFRHLSQK